jgi:hypothetical protein
LGALTGLVHIIRCVNRLTYSTPAVNRATAVVATSATVVGWPKIEFGGRKPDGFDVRPGAE